MYNQRRAIRHKLTFTLRKPRAQSKHGIHSHTVGCVRDRQTDRETENERVSEKERERRRGNFKLCLSNTYQISKIHMPLFYSILEKQTWILNDMQQSDMEPHIV